MKKALAILLTSVFMVTAVACGGGNSSNSSAPAQEEQAADTQEQTEDTVESEVIEETAETEMNIPEDAISYEQYMAAEIDTEVIIMGAIQGKQAMYSNGDDTSVSLYLQDENGGAYFAYALPCTPKEYELMEIGKKIKIKGYKGSFNGEIEIVDAETWQFEDGEYIAEAEDVTALLGTDEIETKMNKKVLFKGMTVEAAGQNDDGEDVAFLYNWDGSGQEGDDLYFNVSVNGETYSFTVESSLCGPETDVYKAVKDLKIGDVVDLEGFLYWYNDPNPHITAVVAQ